MEPLTLLLSLVVGAFCALAIWAYLQRRIADLEASSKALRESLLEKSQDLGKALQDHQNLEGLYQGEMLSRARFEGDAKRSEQLARDSTAQGKRIEQLAAERAAFEKEASRIPDLETQIACLRDGVGKLNAENIKLKAALEEQDRRHSEQISTLTTIREEIDKNLKIITADSLRANQETFLKLATENFEKHKTSADADLEARRKAVEELVGPLKKSLEDYEVHIKSVELERREAQGALTTELKNVAGLQNAVRTETARLTNALKAAPKTRGRWGEQTLKNVLELSGLSAHCDYSVEESFSREGSQLRPDVVIRLPGDRSIVIDAKTSLTAYLDAIEAVDDGERERFLELHVSQIRNHVKQLAAKAYWDGLTVTPDFVVMFIPGDNFYSAALERDPSLFEDAVDQRVIIVTPATLIALAKAVAFGWRQEKVADNAQKVHELGRELYKRIGTMAEHVESCGTALGKSVEHFNKFIGSLENSVLPQARRFKDLQVEGTSTDIEVARAIDGVPRELRRLGQTSSGSAN